MLWSLVTRKFSLLIGSWFCLYFHMLFGLEPQFSRMGKQKVSEFRIKRTYCKIATRGNSLLLDFWIVDNLPYIECRNYYVCNGIPFSFCWAIDIPGFDSMWHHPRYSRRQISWIFFHVQGIGTRCCIHSAVVRKTTAWIRTGLFDFCFWHILKTLRPLKGLFKKWNLELWSFVI